MRPARLRIACLHTAASNIAVFDAAAAGMDVRLEHHVRADLLAAAEAAGGLTEAIRAETRAALAGLGAQADVVLLTCSTLGPAADGYALRVDAVLASQVAACGGTVVVLCAVQTTLEPTRLLFEAAGAVVDLRLVPGAWDRFKAGDIDGYHRRIADAADTAFAEGPKVVALAQASMAGAAALCTRGTPMTSPQSGLAAAVAAGAQTDA
jgi:hypothetical protein